MELTAKLNQNLKWADGSTVTASEVALGIAKGLTFRTLGQRVKVLGTEQINARGWEKRKYKGVQVLDASTFRLLFVSEIQNLTGVIREALSTNSRHNRLWPVKLENNGKNPLILAKFDQVANSDTFTLNVFGSLVKFENFQDCGTADFTIFPEMTSKSFIGYNLKKSPVPSAVSIQTNTKTLSRSKRMALIEILRAAFAKQRKVPGLQPVDSFFLIGEPGFNPNLRWPSTLSEKALMDREYLIAYEIPMFREIVEAYAKDSAVRFKFIPLPNPNGGFDAQILSSGMQDGRQLVLQDILSWPHVADMIQFAPKTQSSLVAIATKSASTVPPDTEILQDFETNAKLEASFAPISRKTAVAFSKTGSPLCLSWSQKGELTFEQGSGCHGD